MICIYILDMDNGAYRKFWELENTVHHCRTAQPETLLNKSAFARTAILGLSLLGVSAWLIFGLMPVSVAADILVYSMTTKDGHFTPDTIEVPAGQKFKLVMKNDGASTEEFESSDLHREKVVMPGKSVEILLGPLKAGTYGFYGEFHPDTAKGKLVAK